MRHAIRSGAVSRSSRSPVGRPARTRAGALHLVASLLLLAAVPVLAQSGGGYDLSWSTVDGGGGTFSSSGDYSLGGTAGQPDLGQVTGGSYSLTGGFWPGGAVAEPDNLIYLPLVLRSH